MGKITYEDRRWQILYKSPDLRKNGVMVLACLSLPLHSIPNRQLLCTYKDKLYYRGYHSKTRFCVVRYNLHLRRRSCLVRRCPSWCSWLRCYRPIASRALPSMHIQSTFHDCQSQHCCINLILIYRLGFASVRLFCTSTFSNRYFLLVEKYRSKCSFGRKVFVEVKLGQKSRSNSTVISIWTKIIKQFFEKIECSWYYPVKFRVKSVGRTVEVQKTSKWCVPIV